VVQPLAAGSCALSLKPNLLPGDCAPYLALRAVTKRYGIEPEVVSDCTLDVARGEFITLLGPSGCGKTTVLRVIAGLVPPSSGRVMLGGGDITASPAHARNIGLVFQNYALFPHLSVERNVAFGLDMRGIRGAPARDRVSRALDLVRLGGFQSRKPSELSGGQQQRVALARALVIEPAILLLDEPLSNLDAKLRDDLRGEIRDIQTRLGITTLFVTHDQAEALTMSDRVAVMNRGQIEQVGTPAEIYERPATPFVATFVGRTNQIAATVESIGPGCSMLVGPGVRIRAPKELTPGRTTTIMIRPHRMRLSRIGTPDCTSLNAVEATIQRVVFAGDLVYYSLLAGDIAMNVESPTSSEGDVAFSAGEAVSVQWPVLDTLVFEHT
jgi:putative spermidine/putrescine transport system ATP-binding protein